MKFRFNDSEQEFGGETLSVTEMLSQRKLTFRLRIVKINGILIPRDKYDTTYINDGDDVSMVYLMSGG